MARFGLVFPGHDSQYPGMNHDLCKSEPMVRSLFAEAGEVLGHELATLRCAATRETPDLTNHTQISVLTADMAAWRASGEAAEPPFVMARYSLGEHAVLHASGAIGLRDGLPLVQKRVCCHRKAVPAGEGGYHRSPAVRGRGPCIVHSAPPSAGHFYQEESFHDIGR